MPKRSSGVASTLLFALLLFLASAKTGAQETPDDKPQENRQQADLLFTQANKAFQEGDYQEALQAYREAYHLSPHAEFLFNIAQCYRLLSWPKEALNYYQRFLLEVPETPLRREIEALIDELEPSSKNVDLAPPPKRKGFPVLYGVSGLSLGLGAAAGGLALAAGFKAKRIAEQENPSIAGFQRASRRARALGIAADLLLGAAVISGGVGYLVYRNNDTKDVKVSISPVGAFVGLRF